VRVRDEQVGDGLDRIRPAWIINHTTGGR
jgi:hypothetical protein